MVHWCSPRLARRPAATLLLVFLMLGGVPLTALPGQATSAQQAREKLVLAFYYMWYGPGAFGSGQMPDSPAQPYVSNHVDVIERQVTEAKAAGIDSFITAWEGTNTETDDNFGPLLDVAARHSFKTAAYFETNYAKQKGDVAGQIQAVVDHFTGHPAYLRWQGKPVIFFWDPAALGGPAAWQAVRRRVDPNNGQIWSVDTTDAAYLDVFDTVHLFSAGKWNAGTDVAAVDRQWRAITDNYNRAHGTSRLWVAGVIPGWDESRVQPPRPAAKVFPRRDGALYKDEWDGATASNPEWITITSYNEWFEGTQIEPSTSYGNRYLDLTRQYATAWKGPQAAPAPVAPPSSCAGGQFFEQTGHAVCGRMAAYWTAHGGLAQQGYPISDE
ncbi:MAG TPA: endo-1,3-alpha-glucanase family glycosylhydrolase, partial [Chloroflexia bacterium]|nr:endo-1,3-alpha-glucanase family glycosylhydrolase [Chloroflexia bacterium]